MRHTKRSPGPAPRVLAENQLPVASALAVACLLFAPPARAQQEPGSLAGSWRAEPMTVRWVIGSWPSACGPRPSGGGDPGGPVTIEERGGELVISGERGAFSTERCWQMHPGLSPRGHTASAESWTTTCRTAPGDPRQELLTTTLVRRGDTLSLEESGQYQYVVQGQTCTASSGRWRTYRRAPIEPAKPSAPAPAPAPCASPGSPARIEVRPARKLMRAGESFQFRAAVFDQAGCSVAAPVEWSLAPAGDAFSLLDGQLRVAADAPDAELRVTATAARQSVVAAVDVVSEARYAALLQSGEFNADGASLDAVTATLTSGSLGARREPATPARADRKWAFVVLVSAIALAFALLGLWLLRRARASAPAGRRELPDTAAVVFAGDETADAALRRGAAANDRTALEPQRRLDATRVEPAAAVVTPKPATVCPVCGSLYDSSVARICPKDGAQLLPINA